MIVTVTPNPSIDRTVTLTAPLTRGAVHRVTSVTTEPGGKGVNVARALTLAGLDAVARAARPRHRSAGGRPAGQLRCRSAACRPPGAVRTNLAITEHDGTTTKLNEPGAALDAAALDALDPVRDRERRDRGVGGAVRLAAARCARPLVRRRRRAARAVPVPGRRRHLRGPARGARRRRSTGPPPT